MATVSFRAGLSAPLAPADEGQEVAESSRSLVEGGRADEDCTLTLLPPSILQLLMRIKHPGRFLIPHPQTPHPTLRPAMPEAGELAVSIYFTGAGEAHPPRGSSLGQRFRLLCQLLQPHPVLGMALQPVPNAGQTPGANGRPSPSAL